MLPSTGYFKGLCCPFYDSGLCERPYCHFRHVKKELQSSSNDGIESGTLQKLVSAAVQKVLQQTEASGTATSTSETITNTNAVITETDLNSITKVTYSPTPISELRKLANVDGENNEESTEPMKRHIPVPYTPRKPSGLLIKRPVEEEITPFIYNPPPLTYTPGSSEAVPLDPYTPKGSIELKDKYLPGTEAPLPEYSPCETQTNTVKHNYSPSGKTDTVLNKHKPKLLEYRPKKVNSTAVPSVKYQPTPRSLAPCFSSDEDEPQSKKSKMASDMNGFDDLGPEFDILDQILDEEKPNNNLPKLSKCKLNNTNDSSNAKDCKENENNINKKKSESKKSNEKIKSSDDSKHKNSHSKSSEKKISHKSSSRDKDKSSEKRKDRDKHKSSDRSKEEKKRADRKKDSSTRKDDKKKHSVSKDVDKNSRHSKSSSSRDSERHSKHSSISKSNSKHKDKSHNNSDKTKENKSKNKTNLSDHLSDSDTFDAELTIDEPHEEIDISEDEESIAMECKKIFEEYIPTETIKNVEQTNHTQDTPDNEYIPSKKRISRTADKNIKIIPKAPIKPDFKVSASQAMAARLEKVREYHAGKIAPSTTSFENLPPKNNFATPNAGNSKIRIAHVPYASTLMYAKKIIPPSPAKSTEPSTSTTITQTVKKGAQRVAHMPSDKFIDRPGVLEPLASKIPANIRSTYLNMMIDECIKIYLSAPDAYARAQHEELTTSKKCKTIQIYKNSAVLAVSRLRKELQECKGVKKSGLDCDTLQKLPHTITGQSGNTGSWSIENKNRRNSVNVNDFIGSKFYNNIKKWILTEEQLKENGFPRPHPSEIKGRAIIYGENKKRPPVGFIRTCCRCKKDYTVDKKGFSVVKEECIYHPNNKYRVRGEARYQCCSQDGTSDGCCVAPSHVYEYVDFENLKGYVSTLTPESIMDDYGVYSLDCEMCYTTQGLDLTRVTVINSSCKVVYETLIKPLHPIIDYNTRYSGITEDQMADVKTTLLEVQATLLAMFNSKTILIGHSLESDFKALKLIHNTVVDTSVLFPHKMGPPYKRALRNLSSEYLKKIIQNSIDGHDSAEDAMVCMELIHYKLKEDLKTR